MWNNGEQLIARAAGHLGVPTCVAMMSITSLEMIAQGTTVPPWFQLYFWKNREKTYNLIKRVETAGIDKLIITGNITGAMVLACHFAFHVVPSWVWPGIRHGLSQPSCHICGKPASPHWYITLRTLNPIYCMPLMTALSALQMT